MLAMIWRLLATRCRISSSSISFSRSRSSFSRSAARLCGDVLDRQQQGGVRVGFVEYLTRVEQQRAATDRRKVVLDLVGLDRSVLGNDLFQKLAKRRDVPLAVGQLVKQAALSIVGRDCERLVERAARRDHPEIAVEHHQGLAHRVHDGIRQRPRLFDAGSCRTSHRRHLSHEFQDPCEQLLATRVRLAALNDREFAAS